MMTLLLATAYTLVAVVALLVVITDEPLRQTMVVGVFGLTLVLLFVLLQAPDVALSEVVVGTIAYPLVLLVTIYRTGGKGGR
jgi:uncharacterized MnhB-related membrane protein